MAAYLVLRLRYKAYFKTKVESEDSCVISDTRLARFCQVSLVLLLALVLLKVILVFAAPAFDLKLTYIALISALPLVVFSSKRLSIIRGIDWHTLIFFAAMFVLMESVWNSGFFQNILGDLHVNLASTEMVLTVSILLSQVISNVPLVALYLPLLRELGAGTAGMMALAAGSTIAGNLSILGAASNVIIIQNAERKSGETLTFFEFFRVGLPLTALNALLYWLYFSVVK